jgi:hypothetical protein
MRAGEASSSNANAYVALTFEHTNTQPSTPTKEKKAEA